MLAARRMMLTAKTSTTIVDNFNRANSASTMGTTSDGQATWLYDSGAQGGHAPTWGINSNQGYCVSTYIAFSTAWDSLAFFDTGSPDIDITVTVAAIGSGNNSGLAWRISSSRNDYYRLDRQTLAKYVGGSFSTISSGAPWTFAAGDVMRVTMIGSTIKVYQNGSLVGTYTDTSITGNTEHGLLGNSVFDASTRFDDYSITSF